MTSNVNEILDTAPPHNLNAERGVLGSILVKPDVFDEVRAMVRPTDFYLDAHTVVYRAMLAISRDGVAIDTLTVADSLKQARKFEVVGGAAYLAEILQSSPTAANAQYYAAIVRDYSRKRKVRRLVEQMLVDTSNGLPTDDLLASLRSDIERIDQGPASAAYRPITTCLADVQPESVQWLWPGLIALGKLTIIAGDPGLGKSFLTLDLAARVTHGVAWPDNTLSKAPLGGVILLTAEDGLADTVRPRLDAMGADATRIVALSAVRDGGGTPVSINLQRDLAAVAEAVKQVTDCKLVVIDPISAYLGKTDSHNNSDVRALLHPLGELAERHKVAIVAVTHLNKSNGGSALYRATGSLAFVAAARAAWLVVKDKEYPTRRLFLPAKNNLAGDTSGMAFRIGDGVVEWEPDPVTIEADKALEPRVAEPDGATGWLREVLASGPIPVTDIFEAGDADGFSQKQLQTAKKRIHATAYKAGFAGGWEWRLPGQDAHEDAQGALPEKQGTFGHLRTSSPSGGENVLSWDDAIDPPKWPTASENGAE